MDPARPSFARGRRARRRHAAAPTGSPAPPPPQRPRRGTPGSPATGPSSPASTASHSSGPAGSEAPASSRPSAPVQPRQPALNGDVLWVYLPAPAELQCAVDNCSMKYSGAAWTSRALSVRRHVEFEHGVRVRERIYVCAVCDAPLASRPSYHHCLARATLVPSTETPRRRCGVCDATFTTKRGLANHLRCHVDQARPSGAARERAPARRVRHVSTSSDTSSSGSGSSSPPAAPRASRRLRGLSPSDAASPVRPSSSPAASGSSTSVGSASVPGSPAPSPAASPAPSEQPLRDAGGTSSPTPYIGVPTPAGVPVASPVLGSPRSPDPASPQRPPSSARHVLVPYDFGPSSSSNGASPAPRGSSAASPVGDAAFLLDNDDTISYDVAVSSPPLDAGSSLVILPGSPVSSASSPSPPASVDEAAADPDDVQERPESDPATLRMPPDHTRLLEDQARLLRSLLRDPPTDESWAQCGEAWTRAVALAVEAVRLPPVRPGRQRRQPDPTNAVDIQRLYRRDRRRAVRLILEGPPQTCAIPLQDLQDHWGRTWSARQADSTLLLGREPAPAGSRYDQLFTGRACSSDQQRLPWDSWTLPADAWFLLPWISGSGHCFTCPITNVGYGTPGICWTSRRQSLVRHLLDEHELKVKVAYTCTLCSTTGLGLHPTLHSCISRGRHELSPLDLYRHKCPECPATMTTRKGLDNHMRKHKKQEAQHRNEQPTTARTSRAAPAATPTGRPPRAAAGNRAPRTMTLRSSQSSNSTTSTGPSPSENSTTLSATPDFPNTNRAGTHTFLPPSRLETRPSITPSPRQHESPHSDTDHDNPRRSQATITRPAPYPSPSSLRQHSWLSKPELQRCDNSISNQRGGVTTRRVTVFVPSPAGPRRSLRYSEDQSTRSTAAQLGHGTGEPSTKSISQEYHPQRRLPHTSNVIRGTFDRRRRRRVTGPRPTDSEPRRDHPLRANRRHERASRAHPAKSGNCFGSPPLLSAGTTSSPSWRRPYRRLIALTHFDPLANGREAFPPGDSATPGRRRSLAAPALSEGHLLLLTGGASRCLDVGRGGPADPGGLGRSWLALATPGCWTAVGESLQLISLLGSSPAACCMPGPVVTAC
ncbi:hypothetical protein MRX96_035386 [Rhipicephalus microplus]